MLEIFVALQKLMTRAKTWASIPQERCKKKSSSRGVDSPASVIKLRGLSRVKPFTTATRSRTKTQLHVANARLTSRGSRL